mmetsp:Transcript_22118/g.48100  ORF Transcript_22118/g.48100 Transcript_22118/m.48100 type:complete len:436 (+) Transcript_22118:174-1481(+)
MRVGIAFYALALTQSVVTTSFSIVHHVPRRRPHSTSSSSSSLYESATDYGHWHVFKAADRLEQYGLPSAISGDERVDSLTGRAITILRRWGNEFAGDPEWRSLLKKKNLLHEIEESIVALCPFFEWLDSRDEGSSPVVFVDVCCGKGVMSVLLSYLLKNDDRVKGIVMLDKAKMNWRHISAANNDVQCDGRPSIQTWEQFNLHDVDVVVTRLNDLGAPLALVGLHLCKTLSPTFVGIVNILGPETCQYMCLAPCCLPRMVAQPTRGLQSGERKTRIIDVLRYEPDEDRLDRLEMNARRKDALKRFSEYECFLCQSSAHRVHACNLLPSDVDERMDIFTAAKQAAPCWKCGQRGHLKSDCPTEQSPGKPSQVIAPCISLDVSEVMVSDFPFDTYCDLLSSAVQRPDVILRDSKLESDQHQADNWNSSRKSTFIIGR